MLLVQCIIIILVTHTFKNPTKAENPIHKHNKKQLTRYMRFQMDLSTLKLSRPRVKVLVLEF
jgi:hypothetical protein